MSDPSKRKYIHNYRAITEKIKYCSARFIPGRGAVAGQCAGSPVCIGVLDEEGIMPGWAKCPQARIEASPLKSPGATLSW